MIDQATDDETSLAMVLEGIYEAQIADRHLPPLDGLTLVRRRRAASKPYRR